MSEERTTFKRKNEIVDSQVRFMTDKVSELDRISSQASLNKDKSSDHFRESLSILMQFRDEQVGRASTNRSFDLTRDDPRDLIESVIQDLHSNSISSSKMVKGLQEAINQLQMEKQQMYQSMNQSRLTTRSMNEEVFGSSPGDQKTAEMVEYLEAEVAHLRAQKLEHERTDSQKKLMSSVQLEMLEKFEKRE